MDALQQAWLEFTEIWEGVLVILTIFVYGIWLLNLGKKSKQQSKQISAIESITSAISEGNKHKKSDRKSKNAPDFIVVRGPVGGLAMAGKIEFKNIGERARITDLVDLSSKCIVEELNFPLDVRAQYFLTVPFNYIDAALNQDGWADEVRIHFIVHFEDITGENKYTLEYSHYRGPNGGEEEFNVSDV